MRFYWLTLLKQILDYLSVKHLKTNMGSDLDVMRQDIQNHIKRFAEIPEEGNKMISKDEV